MRFRRESESEKKEKADRLKNAEETLSKLIAEDTRRKQEFDDREIGSMKIAELRSFVRDVIHHEAEHGHLSLLNRERRSRFGKWIGAMIVAGLLAVLLYASYWRQPVYVAEVSYSGIYLRYGNEKRLIRVIDGEWQLCN